VETLPSDEALGDLTFLFPATYVPAINSTKPKVAPITGTVFSNM